MCVYKYAQMSTRRFHCGYRRLSIITLHSSCLFCSTQKMLSCQMKGNEEKYMLGEELALFIHHHKDWFLLPFLSLISGLNWEILRLKFMHICLWNVYCAPDRAEQLGNMLHFIKKISSQPLSRLETRLFINASFSLFDFSTYWDEWRQDEIPVFSWYFTTTVSSVVLPSQRRQMVNRWTNKKDGDWVKSLHLVCTERTTPKHCPPQLEVPSY